MKITNRDKVFNATRQYVGQTLEPLMIKAVTQEMYPEVNLGSIMPSDLAGINKNGKQYGDVLFAKTGNGYLVLPSDEITLKPSNKRSGETLAEALAAAKALIAKHDSE